jgi:hypothetical protein
MGGIKTFVTNRLTWLSIGYVVLFVALARLGGVTTTAEITRTGTTTAALMAMVVFGDGAIRAYKAHRWPNPDLIASLGAFLFVTGVGLGGLFQILWRLSDFQRFVVNNHLYSFTVSLIGLGIFILIAVPNTIGRGVPKWTRVWIVLAWALAIIGTISLVLFSPDLRWLADVLRPWLLWTSPPG